MSNYLSLNRYMVEGDRYYYARINILEFYGEGGRYRDVSISEIDMSHRFLDILEDAASRPITKLSLFGFSFDNGDPSLVERFVDIFRDWEIEEIEIYSSSMNDSWHQVIATGLVNKPIGIRRIQFINIPQVNLCNFDLPGIYIPTIEFNVSGVIVHQPLQHMRCQRLLLKLIDDSSLANVRGLIERANPDFELELETEGVSDVLNEILELNRVSVLTLRNYDLPEDLLNNLVEGIMKCQTLTKLVFSRDRTRFCRTLWKFFNKIKFHKNLTDIHFRCDHYERCYDFMNTELQETKEYVVNLIELMMINNRLHSMGQLPELPSDVFRHIRSLLVTPKRVRLDSTDH